MSSLDSLFISYMLYIQECVSYMIKLQAGPLMYKNT